MQKELSALIVWRPPERLAADCKTWVARCRICALVAVRPARTPAQRAERDWRPFARLQVDLMEVRPESEDGERYVFTVIDVATRYPFLRAMKTRDSTAIARVLFDIILEAGVIPLVIQGDREFTSDVLTELCFVLGATNLFSTALRPTTNGVIDRTHRTIRTTLRALVQELLRAQPRRLPEFLTRAEYKLRHKPVTLLGHDAPAGSHGIVCGDSHGHDP